MRSILFALALFLPFSAHAALWTIDAAQSSLSFSGKQNGEEYKGTFTRFTPAVEFDPKAPQKGKISVDIDLTSVKMGDKDQQDSVVEPAFFDTQTYPTARYVSTRISTDPDIVDGFIVQGTLTLKGISKPVKLTFNMYRKPGDIAYTAWGKGALMRNDFKVGTGDYESDEWIAYPVAIEFRLRATPQE